MARRYRSPFDHALERAWIGEGPTPDCHERPAEFVDYSHAPEPEVAALMCERCPLLALCADDAKRRRPAWGVRGGSAWAAGKRLR